MGNEASNPQQGQPQMPRRSAQLQPGPFRTRSYARRVPVHHNVHSVPQEISATPHGSLPSTLDSLPGNHHVFTSPSELLKSQTLGATQAVPGLDGRQLHIKFQKVFNEERYKHIKAVYEELNEQSSASTMNEALRGIADMNKRSADHLMQAVEKLRQEGERIEGELGPHEASRAQIRAHFDEQVCRLEPLFEQLLNSSREQMDLVGIRTQMSRDAAVKFRNVAPHSQPEVSSGGTRLNIQSDVQFTEGMQLPLKKPDEEFSPAEQYAQLTAGMNNHLGMTDANRYPLQPVPSDHLHMRVEHNISTPNATQAAPMNQTRELLMHRDISPPPVSADFTPSSRKRKSSMNAQKI